VQGSIYHEVFHQQGTWIAQIHCDKKFLKAEYEQKILLKYIIKYFRKSLIVFKLQKSYIVYTTI